MLSVILLRGRRRKKEREKVSGTGSFYSAGTLKTCEENAVQARWQWDILSVKLTVILHQSPAGGQELMTGLSVQ